MQATGTTEALRPVLRGDAAPEPRDLLVARSWVTPEEVRALSAVDGRSSTLAIARQWAVIGLAVAGALLIGAWWAYVPAVIVVATRQHALLVLMHDGAHGLLARRRVINDAASNALLSFPLLVSTALYRRHHMLHHRLLNSEEDPDIRESRERHTRAGWARLFVKDLAGLSVVDLLNSGSQFSMLALLSGGRPLRRAVPRWQIALFSGEWAAIAVAITVTGTWVAFVLLWALPMLTVLNLILRVRAVAEHAGCDPTPTVEGTRTVLPGRLERWVFAPVNINYHLAHHLYPGVPAVRLRVLHARLSEHDAFRRRARIARGYVLGHSSVLSEVSVERA